MLLFVSYFAAFVACQFRLSHSSFHGELTVQNNALYYQQHLAPARALYSAFGLEAQERLVTRGLE